MGSCTSRQDADNQHKAETDYSYLYLAYEYLLYRLPYCLIHSPPVAVSITISGRPVLPGYYLRFGLQVLPVFIGRKFYQLNIWLVFKKNVPLKTLVDILSIGIIFILKFILYRSNWLPKYTRRTSKLKWREYHLIQEYLSHFTRTRCRSAPWRTIPLSLFM
jgi:hypothetical protein